MFQRCEQQRAYDRFACAPVSSTTSHKREHATHFSKFASSSRTPQLFVSMFHATYRLWLKKFDGDLHIKQTLDIKLRATTQHQQQVHYFCVPCVVYVSHAMSYDLQSTVQLKKPPLCGPGRSSATFYLWLGHDGLT